MSKCYLGHKKLKRIQAILSACTSYKVHRALTRGGWPHYTAQCFVIDTSLPQNHPEYRKVIWLNYKTELVDMWTPGPMTTWTDPKEAV